MGLCATIHHHTCDCGLSNQRTCGRRTCWLSAPLAYRRSSAESPVVGCYSVECVSPSLLRVSINRADGGVEVADCTDGTTLYNVSGFTGALTCIDPAVYCAPKQRVASTPPSRPGVVWLIPGKLIVPVSPTNCALWDLYRALEFASNLSTL